MADDYVQVPPDQSGGKKVRTLQVLDGSGNLVEVQVVALADADGGICGPMTERTGQEIVDLLRVTNKHLAKLSHVL